MIALLSAAQLSGETWDCVLPRQWVRTFDWIEHNVRMPDGTPINELSLISFPTRELFEVKLNEFDLVILDRYRRRGVLPSAYLRNIVDYVAAGGALKGSVQAVVETGVVGEQSQTEAVGVRRDQGQRAVAGARMQGAGDVAGGVQQRFADQRGAGHDQRPFGSEQVLGDALCQCGAVRIQAGDRRGAGIDGVGHREAKPGQIVGAGVVGLFGDVVQAGGGDAA